MTDFDSQGTTRGEWAQTATSSRGGIQPQSSTGGEARQKRFALLASRVAAQLRAGRSRVKPEPAVCTDSVVPRAVSLRGSLEAQRDQVMNSRINLSPESSIGTRRIATMDQVRRKTENKILEHLMN